MANTKSAEKRMRQNRQRRDHNRIYRSRMRTAIRRLRAAIEGGDADAARELLSKTLRVIDVTAQKKVIHRNAAGRYKSRLTRAVAALGEKKSA
ncbi:MAG: 30S ribosomal protein S20 [Acidobacteriota bacterium]|jgi:small subunit ribosomal protein S20